MQLFKVIQSCSIDVLLQILKAISIHPDALDDIYCKSCQQNSGYENCPCYETDVCPFDHDTVLKWALEQDWRKIYEEQFKVN